MEKKSSYVPLKETDFEMIRRQSNSSNYSYQVDQRKSFHLPKRLKKTLYCVISLLLLGICLILVGIIKVKWDDSFKEGLPFFALATIVLIPGLFYTYQFCKARCTNDVDTRHEILSDIPQL